MIVYGSLDVRPRKGFVAAVALGPDDVNADGHGDVVDLLILVDTLGKALGEDGHDPTCDLSGDGTIDLADLRIMIGDRGK